MKKSTLFLSMLLFLLSLSSCGTQQSYIDNPQVGDVYQLECKNVVPDSPIAYNLIKVKEIKGDTLVLVQNLAYYHEKVYCMTALDYFNLKETFTMTKAEVSQQFADGKIVDVFRVYEEACLGHEK